MKKLVIIVVVSLFIILPLVHFFWGIFEKDWAILPITRSKKTVEITEISEGIFTKDMIKGQWVLYLYYPNVTRTLELMIDDEGNAVSKSEESDDVMSVVLNENGSLEMRSSSLNLKGVMDKTREHLDGMAVVKDASSPIPFSCFKIGMYTEEQ